MKDYVTFLPSSHITHLLNRDSSPMGNNTVKSDLIELIPSEAATASVCDALPDNQEDIILVCYSTLVNFHAIKDYLLKISTYIRFFQQENECINFIKTIQTENIFLIISSEIRQELLLEFNTSDSIDSIFIYSDSKEVMISKASKINGVYTCTFDLMRSIQKNIRLREKQLETFSVYNKNQKNTRVLTQESGSFLFLQFFKDVLVNMQQTSESKMEMIEKCKAYYCGKITELQDIELFSNTYKSTDAIKWYTKQSFVYKVINEALRTEDMDALFAFRFFIIDLCRNLRSKYQAIKKRHQTLTLYRGFSLTTDEIQLFKDNVGNLISLNGFLSTSHLRSVAFEFASKPKKRQAEKVLLEIHVNMKIANKVIMADVAKYSAFPEESEVLFDLGAAFKIDSCSYDCMNHLWLVTTTATNEGIDIANDYIEYQQKKVIHSDIVLMFGHLLADMGQNEKSKKYFESILSLCPNDEEVACIYHNMGRMYRLKEEYIHALDHYNRSYEMHLSAQPQRLVSAAKCLNGIGIVYIDLHNYDLAIKHLTYALKIYEESLSKHHSEIASALNNLANAHQNKGEWDRALEYLKRAQNINDRTLPLNHPNHATVLNNIGNIYYNRACYDQALDCYLKVLEIRKKVLPSHHDDLIRTHDNIGLVYYAMQQYKKACKEFHMAKEISEKSLPVTNTLFIQVKSHLDLADEKYKI